MTDEERSEQQVSDALGDQPDEFAQAQKRVEMSGGLAPHENLVGVGNNPTDQLAPTDDVRDPEGDSGQPQTSEEVAELQDQEASRGSDEADEDEDEEE